MSNAANCTDTDSFVVTVNSNPTVNIAGTASICIGQTSTLDAGAGFTQYLWNDGTTAQTLVASAAGTYNVTVTNANGCTATATVNITTFNRPVCSIDILQEVTDPALNDGQLRCVVTGGTAPFTFLWSNGATTASVTNFGIGTRMSGTAVKVCGDTLALNCRRWLISS